MSLSSPRWLVLPVILVATHFTARAAEAGRPFLWRIEGGTKPSYVFGTIHLSGADVTALSPATEKAVASTDALYTEVPMDMATQMKAATSLIGGESLGKVLPKDLYERAEAELKRINPQLNLQPFDQMKIWGLAVTIPLLEEQLKNPGALPLDAQLYTTAQRTGKEVGGIETMEEQMGLFEQFNKDEQIAMLKSTLDEMERARKEGRNPVEELRKGYLSGDLAKLDKMLNEWMSGFDPKLLARFMEALLTKRNHVMAERIGEKLKSAPGKSQFFAIGAGHLMGEEGVLKLLEKQGLKVTRVMEGT
jgi:uncharacterized protein YbaP (TraB family)